MSSDTDNPGMKAAARVVAIVAIVLAIALVILTMIVLDRRPRTHDAYIFAYSAALTPEVSGRIVALNVTNNQAVKRGDILLQIDREPFELKLRQAQAEVAALQANIDLTSRQVTAQGSGAEAAASQVGKAREQLSLARSTRERLEPLLANGFATQQQIDEARTNEATAASSLAAATQQAAQAHEAIGDVESLKAQLAAAQANEALAARDLRETVIYAPFDGRIAGLDLALGSFAVAAHPIFTLVQSNNWYAIADFRETDLVGLRVGDNATVWMMGRENQPISGKVESIGAGVSVSGASGPGLPSVDRNLNWVVVAQRFPVWVHLNTPNDDAMRIGATVSVRVQPHEAR